MASWYDLGYSLKGADGVSVTSASIDGSGNLTLTLSSGATLGPFAVKGPPGSDGAPGATGQAGRGVASASYNATDGTLTLTFTDSSTAGPWPVRGADGKSITFSATVATYADLPTNLTSSDAGDGYYVEADGQLYPWDGTHFPAEGSGIAVQGPQGIQGVQGVRGTRLTAQTVPPSTDVLVGDLNINPSTGEITQYLESAPS